uniref:Uncharacterized protein LOC100181567 n=1 Tax=Phallusia mammillata TaxID=59560 RepID=A0A6F9DI56_9ASCI|nr:uncharacterized protein LOC100181567 [Phallusia mammillata]
MYKTFIVLYVLFTSLHHFCESTKIPTYKHPTISKQLCFECPPGYRLESVGIEAKKCPTTPMGDPSFPNCIQCPEGYYSEQWNTLHYCREQDPCTKPYQFVLYHGRQTQPNICGCIHGFVDKHNCRPPNTKQCQQNTQMSKQPDLPTALTTQSLSERDNVNEPEVNLLISIGVCVAFVMICLILAIRLYIVSHQNEAKREHCKANGKFRKDVFKEAAKHVEQNLSPVYIHKFMRNGLDFDQNVIERITQGANGQPAKIIMNAIEHWKGQKPGTNVDDLISALENSGLQTIANEVKELVKRPHDADNCDLESLV